MNSIKRKKIHSAFLVLLLTLILLVSAHGIERVSVSSAGVEAYGFNQFPAISADGRYVAFSSLATNLDPGDTDGYYDVYVFDRFTDTIEFISKPIIGFYGVGWTGKPSISDNGRYIAFNSEDMHLVPNDINGMGYDVFIYDRENKNMEILTNQWGGGGSPCISGNGQYVAFSTVSGGYRLYNRINATSIIMPMDSAMNFSLSTDGRYVAFQSSDSDLVSNDTNSKEDIFVYDRETALIEIVSIGSLGIGNNDSRNPSISADGRYVAFESNASNLIANDTNNCKDIFVYDRINDTIDIASVNPNGILGNGTSSYPSISGDGRYVTFQSSASNLIANDYNGYDDIFVYDRINNTINVASKDSSNYLGIANSIIPAISKNGKYVTFMSWATNFVANDNNGTADIFVTPDFNPTLKSDMIIRNHSDTTYIGSGIINTDGTNQTKLQSVDTNTHAIYWIKITNPGDVYDSYKIKGPTGGNGWTVTYYKHASPNSIDITSQVTSAEGWTTPTIAPGEYNTLVYAYVRPDTTVPIGTTKDILVTARSFGDNTKVDAVKAITTRQ